MTIQERMFQLETDLIKNTLKYLDKGNINRVKWNIERLNDLGLLNKQNAKLIKQAQGDIAPMVRTELLKAQFEANRGLEKLISAKKLSQAVPFNASQRVKSILSAYETKALNDISQTGSTLVAHLSSVYEKTISDTIALKLVEGAGTREAIEQTAKSLLTQNLPALIDKGGRTWSIEAYTQMVVRTNQRQIVTQTQMTRMDEFEIDLIEISSHLGSRPKCAPYQGKVFSRSGSNPNYPALSSTSYGEIDGLFGINCGHKMYPYIEGTKKTSEEYPKKENDKAYKQSQEQRRLEREIRNTKRNIQIGKEMGMTDFVRQQQGKLERDKQRMKSFINKTGRTERLDRQRIY